MKIRSYCCVQVRDHPNAIDLREVFMKAACTQLNLDGVQCPVTCNSNCYPCTDSPTSTPTATPTSTPTATPTNEPTEAPTVVVPTEAPTSDPTEPVVVPTTVVVPTEPPTTPTFPPEKMVECKSTGDPHFTSFTGKRFDFQQPGEFQLFESTASNLVVHTYHCPWIKKYVGAVSNIAVAVKVANYTIQISSKQLTICTSSSDCKEKAEGDHELTGGVTVSHKNNKFVIRGPPTITGQRGEVRGYKKNYGEDKMPSGFFYNLYGLLPESSAVAVTGLCKSEDTCPKMYEANPVVSAAESFFTEKALDDMNEMCFGKCKDGNRPDKTGGCTKIKDKCELEACDNPEKLKTCHCKENNATVADAKTACAASACGEDTDACELDFCMSGGDPDVAVTYEGMKVNVCEVACAKCKDTGGTCSSCTESASCKPTCTHPAGARTTNANGCDSIRDKAECCSSYDGRPAWASNCVPGDWAPAAPALWSQVGDDKSKCKDKPTQKTSEQILVANQDECQAKAVKANVEWYSFRQNAEDGKHKCTHSKSCAQFTTGATNDWQRFNFNAPKKVDDTQLWSQVGDDKTKCADNVPAQETSEKKKVANRDECQADAVKAEVEWYSFRESNGQCTHSKSCEKVKTTGTNMWRIFNSK